VEDIPAILAPGLSWPADSVATVTFETTTRRLVLRRPTTADGEFHSAVHSDPRLYAHAPHAPREAIADAMAAHEHQMGGR
jgi:hypothetical protein